MITALALFALASCAGTPPAATAAKSVPVAIKAFRFQPTELEITAGTTVTWTNNDAILHTVTSGTSVKKDDFGNYDLHPDGRVDGMLPDQGASFSFTFTTPGEYAYFCSRHNNMTARVIVH